MSDPDVTTLPNDWSGRRRPVADGSGQAVVDASVSADPAVHGATAATHEETVVDLRNDPGGTPTLPGGGSPVSLSIVMPAHNEELTIEVAVRRLLSVALPCPVELIVVDDGSTDRTSAALRTFDDRRLRVQRHPINLGKGAAVLTGASRAAGTHLLIFDADLEYNPRDIPKLLEPVLAGDAQIVYGTRIFGMNTVYPSFRYALGNRMTTFAANVLFDSCLSDLHTCLKLVPLDIFRRLQLTETGFGLDTEITAELLRRGERPYEVAVSYSGRTRGDGKKIRWVDGVQCLSVLGRVRVRRGEPASPTAPGPPPVTGAAASPVPAVPAVDHPPGAELRRRPDLTPPPDNS